MTTKMLITYGSWADSTWEVAAKMAETLKANLNIDIDVLPAKTVKDISTYQAVVIGSSIRAGMFHPSIGKFIKRHRKVLSNIPSAFFISCLTMKEDNEANRNTTAAYMNKLYSKVPEFKPIELGLFGGAVNYEKLPFLFRKMFEKSEEMAEGDFRDWNEINRWIVETSNKLLLQTS
ncbi:MAG: flavodoxin domain-containing protein [Anaerolineaceae bacterium]|nr:flavodoxin domain-containing protein [Anaerolineaceae bacterium]